MPLARPSSLVLLLLYAALAACSGRDRAVPGGDSARAASSRDSSRAASAAESTAAARDEWNKAEVVKRLTEAGLVVADSGETARRPGLQANGELLHVSGSDLEIYVFRDLAARRRAGAALDTTARGLPSVQHPRYIFSGNLIAVHTTPSDHLAERVQNALTARHTGAP